MYLKKSRFYFLNNEDNVTFDEVKRWLDVKRNKNDFAAITIDEARLLCLSEIHANRLKEEQKNCYDKYKLHKVLLDLEAKMSIKNERVIERHYYAMDKNIFLLNYAYDDESISNFVKWHKDLKKIAGTEKQTIFNDKYYADNKHKRYDVQPVLYGDVEYLETVRKVDPSERFVSRFGMERIGRPKELVLSSKLDNMKKNSAPFAVLPLCFILKKLVYMDYNDRKIFNMGSKNIKARRKMREQLIEEIEAETKVETNEKTNIIEALFKSDGLFPKFKEMYMKYANKIPAYTLEMRRKNRINRYKLLKLLYCLSVNMSNNKNSRFRFFEMISRNSMENYDNPFDVCNVDWKSKNADVSRAFKAELMLELDLTFITAVEKNMSYIRYSALRILLCGHDQVANDKFFELLGGEINVNAFLKMTINELNKFSFENFVPEEAREGSVFGFDELNFFEQIYFTHTRFEHLSYYHDLRKCYKIAEKLIDLYVTVIPQCIYEEIRDSTERTCFASYEEAFQEMKDNFSEKYRSFVFSFDKTNFTDSVKRTNYRKEQRRKFLGQFENIFYIAQKYTWLRCGNQMSLFYLLKVSHIYFWLLKVNNFVEFSIKSEHYQQTEKDDIGMKIFTEYEIGLSSVLKRLFEEQHKKQPNKNKDDKLGNLYVAAVEHIFDMLLLRMVEEKALTVKTLNQLYMAEANFKYKLFKEDSWNLAAIACDRFREIYLKKFWVEELKKLRPNIFRDAGIDPSKYYM